MSETFPKVRHQSAVLVTEDGARHRVEVLPPSDPFWEQVKADLESLSSLVADLKLQRQIEAYISSSSYQSQRDHEIIYEALMRERSSPHAFYLFRCGQCSEWIALTQDAEYCLRCGFLCQPCAKEHAWVLSVLQRQETRGEAQ